MTGAGASPPPTARRTKSERLGSFIRRTSWLRRLIFATYRAVPAVVAVVLALIALYPILLGPTDKLTAAFAALVGGELSFASVAFSASRSRPRDVRWQQRMALSGSVLFQSSVPMAVALAMSVVRDGFAARLGEWVWLDVVLRGAMFVFAASAIGIAFLGFHTLIVLFGPTLDESVVERLSRIGEAIDRDRADPV